MTQTTSIWTSVLPYAVVFAVFYLILILPQRRREKQHMDMLSSIKEGDEIITFGGIIGKVYHIQDDELSIESGLERTKLKIAKWAIKTVNKPKTEEK